MSDEQVSAQDAQTGAQDAPANREKPEGQVEALPEWAQRLIKELRDEAAQRRIALKREQEEAQKREQARLAEEGRWRELAEARERELAKLMPYQERAQQLEAALAASNDARIKRIPEDMRSLVPSDYPPERLATWLDANFERLTKPAAPTLDAGAGMANKGVTLTEEQRAMARAMGMTDEQFAQQLARTRPRS